MIDPRCGASRSAVSAKTKALGCYYCGRPATSREHVPPRCIFPENRDVGGIDHRVNLITVPSCDDHNLKKSREDEFLMACITPLVGNGGVGYVQTQTKLSRAVSRSAGRLLDAAMFDAKRDTLVAPDGTRFPVLIGRADMPRLCCALECVARGLYFHARGSRFVGKCRVIPGFIQFPEDSQLEVIKVLTRLMFIGERAGWLECGANREVFFFEIGPEDQYGLIPMVMTFFKQAQVFVAFQPEGVVLPFRTLDEATSENPIKVDVHFEGHQA